METIDSLKQEIENKNRYILNAYKKFGRIFEQFIPFANNFQWDKSKFIFLGKPIDGIVFEDNRIIFLEFKTGQSKLTPNQERVKQLVSEGKIEFKEVRY